MSLLSYAARISISVHFAKKSFFSAKSLVVIIFCSTFALAFTAGALSCRRWASFFDRIYMDRE